MAYTSYQEIKGTLGPEVPYISALVAAQHEDMEVKRAEPNYDTRRQLILYTSKAMLGFDHATYKVSPSRS